MKKRFVALLSMFIFIFTSIIGRCAYITFSKAYAVSDTYNSYSISIGKLYPYIYDRTAHKLNNENTTPIAVIRPNEKCMAELEKLFDADEVNEIINELSEGYPVTRELNKKADTKHIQIYDRIEQNSEHMLCRHLLDYECGGLESKINDEIGELHINFPVDATGRLLSGDSGELINNNYDSRDGVVVSIDKNIQQICESSVNSINKGAVVVMDVNTSQLLACVSIGDDYNNRALSNYAVGSIFKLVVCACAIENNVNLIYNCTGSVKVSDTTFNCQKNKAHGIQNMKSAIANSCNCYFVNLALKLGADKLYATSKALGFGQQFELYENWIISGGNMPSLSTINYSIGQLALLGFGQGQLNDSPVHFASVISCIANGGVYNPPTLDIKDSTDNHILSKSTCKTILEYMHYVVTNGTGANANYNNETSGKTATAQSGIYNNDKEILNTWFAGLYPYDNPKYAIVVMCEDGTSGAEDCCPVFRTIVEKLDKK